MLSTEQHVRAGSDYYIYTPSAQGRSLFLCPLFTGHFYYEPGYCLRRSAFDSFLIMYIKKGSCEIDFENGHYQASEGQVLLLDCYAPHSYYTSCGWEAEWLHFDGPCARGYYQAITAENGLVLSLRSPYRFEKYLHRICQQFREGAPLKEALLNNYIVNILTELLIGKPSKNTTPLSSSVLEDSIAYINEHLSQPLTLEELAAQVSLSPFYFSRLFKKETGFTPHHYITTARLNHAKYLLRTSDASVKNICFASGFTSESSFCATFRKELGITPSEYRGKLKR